MGLGVGVEHARAYLDHPGCDLRWIYDIDAEAAARAHATLGPVAIASSFEQILADAGVDVVSIASYDDAHFGQVVAALEADKHVFVEKPLCRSFDELRHIRDAYARRETLHLQSNLVLRAAPLYCWLRQQVAAGTFGEIYAIDGEYLYGRLHKITEGWRKDVRDYSVTLGGGIHLLDLILSAAGERPTHVTAAGNRISTAATAFRYNDYVTATFSFGSGLVARLAANFGCVHPHQHVARLFGTKATFIYDAGGARLHVSRESSAPGARVAETPFPRSKGDLIPAFVNAILRGEGGHAAAQREFDVIGACLAADDALAICDVVEIPYL